MAETKEAQSTTAETKVAAAKPARRPAAKSAKAKTFDPLRVPYFDSAGDRQGDVLLPKVIFGERPNVAVMHQAYTRQLANARQGTASTKTRATVSGGGAKPYRQKGTGRARHGSIREPSMKGGANVFGPRPRSFAQRMPRQMRRLALRSALSQKALDGRVRVIEAFGFEEPRTKQAADLMDAIGFDDTALVVLPAPNLVVSRSFENLGAAKIVLARNMNVRDLLTYSYLLLAKDSLELLEENFRKPSRNSKAADGEREPAGEASE